MRIAIDIDEVLTPFLPTLLKWRPPLRTVPSRYPYNFSKIYDISERESQNLVQNFYHTEEFSNLKPFAHTKQVLGSISEFHKLYIVTGRQEPVRLQTERWIEKWYPGIFADVILTNSFTDKEVSKSTICKILNIGLIVDDNLDTCIHCMVNGTKAVNFIGDPVYPWCTRNDISFGQWSHPPDALLFTYNAK